MDLETHDEQEYVLMVTEAECTSLLDTETEAECQKRKRDLTPPRIKMTKAEKELGGHGQLARDN